MECRNGNIWSMGDRQLFPPTIVSPALKRIGGYRLLPAGKPTFRYRPIGRLVYPSIVIPKGVIWQAIWLLDITFCSRQNCIVPRVCDAHGANCWKSRLNCQGLLVPASPPLSSIKSLIY